MPTIRPSTDLRINYNEISEFCHEYTEPVFITKNGKGDLVVMSMETYELLSGKLGVYTLLTEGFCPAPTALNHRFNAVFRGKCEPKVRRDIKSNLWYAFIS